MNYFKPIRFFIVLGITLTLSACGGGGDTDTTAPITTASPAGGNYTSVQTVTLTCTDNGGGSGCAATYYTTNGSAPDTSSSAYTGAITIDADTTLMFFSVDAEGNMETVKTETYVISTVTDTYTISGTVSGLTGTGLALDLNGGAQILPVTAGATSFVFPTALDDGSAYAVTISAQPTGHMCAVANGSGTISGANVTNVSVSCSNNSSSVRKLPDTGQTASYTATFGEDSDYTINPPSYTDNGDGTVTDNVTSLMWQKEDDNLAYNWYEATGTAEATYNPDGATDVCGSLTLAGYTDWRLTSKKELMSIVNYGTWSPTIDATYFPNTNSSADYWSSTTFAVDTSFAWLVGFYDGYVFYNGKTDGYYVRCVRLGQNAASFTDNGDGTVTDNVTTLMWQQQDDDITKTWETAITYCEGLSLAGYADWRLPNVKELESITDDSTTNPATDTTYFPGTNSSYYWSSTTYALDTSFAWFVPFGYGLVFYNGKADYYAVHVRCVRLGPMKITAATYL